MKNRISHLIILVIALLLLDFAPARANTQYTWNAGNGYWSVAGNWSPAVVPNSETADVVIDNKYWQNVTVQVNGPTRVGNLSVNDGDTLSIMSAVNLFLGYYTVPPPVVINDGIIRVNGTGRLYNYTYGMVILSGTGRLILNSGWLINGCDHISCGFVNDVGHTIEGGGTITTRPNFVNNGNIIANNGTLKFAIQIDNAQGTMRVKPGSSLQLYYATGGNIILEGGTLILGAGHYTDIMFQGTGQISQTNGGLGSSTATIDGNTQFASSSDITFTGAGAITFAFPTLTAQNLTLRVAGATLGASGNVNLGTVGQVSTGRLILDGNPASTLNGGSFTLNAFTLEGGGAIYSAIINNNEIIANNGTLNIHGAVTGDGYTSVTDNAILNLLTGFQTANLSMSHLAGLQVAASKVVNLTGHFSFEQTDPAKWNWGSNSVLKMSASNHQLEVGGRDLGTSASGFTNNFALPGLSLESWATVQLVDNIDNGHRGPGAEALYVSSLSVPIYSTLDLNGVKLYTMLNGNPYRVKAGDGNKFGGGQIIDKRTNSNNAALNLLLFD